MMTGATATSSGTHYDDVVGVEVTIDGMLVIADRLNIMDFPPSLGIRLNIPQPDLRQTVWDQVARDLTAQGVLNLYGDPHPEVAAMVDTLSRSDRVLEGRWWRRDVGGKMVRFVVCRKGERHVVAARDDDMLVLQRVAPQIGLANMVATVLGSAPAAEVEPLTGVAAELASCRTAGELQAYGVAVPSARAYADIISEPSSWVELTVTERHPGGTQTTADVAAGVLDSRHGRIVSIPRRVSGELYGSFLSGTQENLQRALDGLIEFLPSKTWFDQSEADGFHDGSHGE
ncbi:ESX secretion-associated protein EspG [Mycobacterium sp. PS03-16]|uniref:ESX secretion-associated protein EspG n=1 Tax=Mycobacterium sp. PS03-16 TaxID=2559611 RepID=UPI00107343D9|nr:ESX secretion-associated protein EspG [Mycobacterium sp. PS03-16]TFV54354.1 ESX secretion-associated protein EspG [Mycobacterium sp. PS03-16]